MAEKLSISSDMFAVMRDQFDVVLQSLVALTEGAYEGEITLKVKLDKQIRENEDTLFPTEALRASWDITRTLKAKKRKVSEWTRDEYFIWTQDEYIKWTQDEYIIGKDDDGKPVISKAQVSIFDNKEEI